MRTFTHGIGALLFASALTSFTLLTSCSSSSSGTAATSAVTKTIGPEGGTITVDGATVTFPANAVAAPLSITITPTTDAPPSGMVALSRVYRCEPAGTTFAQNVTMAMTFQGDPTTATMFWSTGSDPAFKDVGGVADGTTMRATVQHFSAGFVGKKP